MPLLYPLIPACHPVGAHQRGEGVSSSPPLADLWVRGFLIVTSSFDEKMKIKIPPNPL